MNVSVSDCTHSYPRDSRNPIYVARWFRGDELLHSQRSTLPEIAILCHATRIPASLAEGGGDPIGRMDVDGCIEWFD